MSRTEIHKQASEYLKSIKPINSERDRTHCAGLDIGSKKERTL